MSGPSQLADADLRAHLAAARLVVLDVDGVLTDGRVVYGAGEELQAFDVRDGLGVQLLLREGLEMAWISGRGCAATRRRAEELGVRELHLRSGPKSLVLASVQERLGIAPAETIAMGDDLPDLALGALAAVLAAPADAHPEVLARARFVCAARGGRGAVRELAEAVLRARGRWQPVLDAHAR